MLFEKNLRIGYFSEMGVGPAAVEFGVDAVAQVQDCCRGIGVKSFGKPEFTAQLQQACQGSQQSQREVEELSRRLLKKAR